MDMDRSGSSSPKVCEAAEETCPVLIDNRRDRELPAKKEISSTYPPELAAFCAAMPSKSNRGTGQLLQAGIEDVDAVRPECRCQRRQIW